MKRIIAMLFTAALVTMPFVAQADDVRSAEECAATSTASDPTAVAQTGDAEGRGSVCVSDGDETNGNEAYVGGDATQPCGRVEVGGVILTGGDTDCH